MAEGTPITQRAKAVLDRMVAEAEDGLWKGSMTRLFAQLEVPHSYYSRVLDTLRESGAVEQVQRGGGPLPSIWRIVDPSVDLKEYRREAMDRRVTLEKRVEAIEATLSKTPTFDVQKAIASLQGDIEYLKRRVDKKNRQETASEG